MTPEFVELVREALQDRMSAYAGELDFLPGDERCAFKGTFGIGFRSANFEVMHTAYKYIGPSPKKIADEVAKQIVTEMRLTGPFVKKDLNAPQD